MRPSTQSLSGRFPERSWRYSRRSCPGPRSTSWSSWSWPLSTPPSVVVSSSSKTYIFTVHPAPLNIRVGGKGSTRSRMAFMATGRERGSDGQMAESQLSELQNMRVLLEEARALARDLAYHRRARLEDVLGRALEEVDRQIEELRSSSRD